MKERIGKGAYGSVFIAVDRINGKLIAIKKLYPNSETAVMDIIKEINILKSMGKSKYIAEYHETFVCREFLWICKKKKKFFLIFFLIFFFIFKGMEYVEGGNLSKDVFREGGFSMNEIASIASEILMGLKHLHANKLVHRDIKLENIMLNREGNIKLVDFGISKSLDSQEEKCKTQVGTPVKKKKKNYFIFLLFLIFFLVHDGS